MLLDESSKGFEPEGAWKPAGGRFQGEAACPAGQVESLYPYNERRYRRLMKGALFDMMKNKE